MKVRIGNYRKEGAKNPRIERIDIHPWDTYSAYHTLSLVIYPMLVAYRKDVVDKGVVPSDFFQTIDVSGKTEEEAKELHEKHYAEALEKWIHCLDKMIWTFNEIRHDFAGEEEFFKTNEAAGIEDLEHRYDLDKDGLNDYLEAIDDGLHLFARHFRSLWW